MGSSTGDAGKAYATGGMSLAPQGVQDSALGFLGFDTGPKAPGGQFGNQSNSELQGQNSLYGDAKFNDYLSNYLQGNTGDPSEILRSDAFTPAQKTEAMNAIATGPMSGSKYATDQVMNNPILGGLYGKGGQLSQAEDQLSGLYKQGFELKPEDQTLYGQTAGNIARQFGQQGNQAASDLASRGLSNSGAAGATFSGLAGNQNEQLAQAQQQIMQQRFQNTQGQIGQYQNFVNSMGNSANTAINDQYSRQLAGANFQKNGLIQGANVQNQANNSQNAYNMEAAQFNAANKPKNFMDFATAGAGQGIQSGVSGATSGAFGGA